MMKFATRVYKIETSGKQDKKRIKNRLQPTKTVLKAMNFCILYGLSLPLLDIILSKLTVQLSILISCKKKMGKKI
ncbi:hypothetical protein BpHYR1_009227 [Brachionus plicatilis]|uniref:Uncharacterized protein n=1 Tax=Brachionus plicatilis TaxID=10195 RepID=A0A3M7Q6B6_BRAPC|nr:hypothetical protein BpHYR1_009227 [Brachionus plicatilis]